MHNITSNSQNPPLIDPNFVQVVEIISTAVISSVVLGIIFGPLAAIAGLCIGFRLGIYAVPKIHDCLKSEPAISDPTPLTAEEQAEVDRLTHELRQEFDEWDQDSTQLNQELAQFNQEYKQLIHAYTDNEDDRLTRKGALLDQRVVDLNRKKCRMNREMLRLHPELAQDSEWMRQTKIDRCTAIESYMLQLQLRTLDRNRNINIDG